MKTCITALLVCINLVIIFQLFDQEQRASCNLNEYLKSCVLHTITACSGFFLLQVPFPNPLDSVKLLLNICHSQLKQEDANWFAERVVAWSLKFSVSAQQKETVMELLHRTLTH